MRTAVVSGVIAAIVGVIMLLTKNDPSGPNADMVIGIASGAAYGLVAVGIVIVYKGARVFNFAQGEFGTIAAFTAFVLMEQVDSVFGNKVDIPYYVAAPAAIFFTILIGLILERGVVRPLLNAPRVNLLVATIAFSLLAIGIEILLFRPEPKVLQPLIQTVDKATGKPVGPEIFGYFLEPQRIVIIGVLVVMAIALGYFFSRTNLGLAVLATSQDPLATRVVGIGVERMSQFIWASAAFFGAVAGILYVPLSGLAPGAVTSAILIPAFAAAVIGGMTSLPGAFVGGVVVGLIQGLAGWASNHFYLGEQTWSLIVPGAIDVALVVTLLAVLLVRPQGLLGSEA
ncbi:MAG: branched-chain amino acid ABC transporter permease [Actinomycetota bacterium]|nr:branched-chain amino acid ABC transporter permease [Actinomycetota bacterium]